MLISCLPVSCAAVASTAVLHDAHLPNYEGLPEPAAPSVCSSPQSNHQAGAPCHPHRSLLSRLCWGYIRFNSCFISLSLGCRLHAAAGTAQAGQVRPRQMLKRARQAVQAAHLAAHSQWQTSGGPAAVWAGQFSTLTPLQQGNLSSAAATEALQIRSAAVAYPCRSPRPPQLIAIRC